MIEPDAAPRPTNPARATAVGLALLVALAVGVALVAPGGANPDRLALAATGDATQSERSAAPASAAGDASTAIYPGYSAVDYRFEGTFPDLGSQAPAWRLQTRALDRADVTRFASALALTGDPAARDGGWFLETSDGALTVFPSGDGWSVNFYRSAAVGARTPMTLGERDAAEAARRVLDRMGVLAGEWRVETYRTEFGVAVGCVVPEGGITAEEAEKLRRAEEMAALDPDTPVSSEPAPASAEPATAGADRPPVASDVAAGGPEPEPPVPGYGVSFFPVLGGVRADWAAWGVMVRGDGRIENLYGTSATFERVGDYKLRTVEAAFDELRAGPGTGVRILAGDSGGAAEGTAAAGDAAPVGAPPVATVEPGIPIERMEPQSVTITAVERTLIPWGVWTGDTIALHLVPAYRFTGMFESGDPFETSVIALHPDAITPPPDVTDMPARPEPLIDPGGTVSGGAGSSGSGGAASTPAAPRVEVPPAKG